MSRSKAYQKLLNSKRWRELRASYREAHPLCERCLAEGRVSPTVDIHHRVPVESAKTDYDMQALCFDWNNLQALCISCHVEVHQQMGKATKANHQEREQQQTERWLDKWIKKK